MYALKQRERPFYKALGSQTGGGLSPKAPDTSLTHFYFQHFRVLRNVSSDRTLLDEVYRLRYQVYCREHPFENPNDFPDGREHDEYDQRAVHSLLLHAGSDAVAGTVRLVLPWRDGQKAVGKLPIEGLISETTQAEFNQLPRETLAEVSRFAISRVFRQRVSDRGYSMGGFLSESDSNQRRRIPHMCLGLIGALVHNTHQFGLTHWCAEMEPSLLRMLRLLGIEFRSLGPLIDYHGIRQPCFIDVDSMLRRVRVKRPDVYDLLTDGL